MVGVRALRRIAQRFKGRTRCLQGVAPRMVQFRIAFPILALSALVVVIGAGCATNERAPQRTSQIGCDEAVAQGTAFGRGQARAIAVNSLANQAGDVRGYLLSQGFRQIRATGRSVTCRTHPFGNGLQQCTAVARFCGG